MRRPQPGRRGSVQLSAGAWRCGAVSCWPPSRTSTRWGGTARRSIRMPSCSPKSSIPARWIAPNVTSTSTRNGAPRPMPTRPFPRCSTSSSSASTNSPRAPSGISGMRRHSTVSTLMGEKRYVPLWDRTEVAREGVTCDHLPPDPGGIQPRERRATDRSGPIYDPMTGGGDGSTLKDVIAKRDQYKVKTGSRWRRAGHPHRTSSTSPR